MTEIWRHYEGYAEARQKVLAQSAKEDLELIDLLFGRSELNANATPEEIKAEALRQNEIEWRSERREHAEAWADIIKADQAARAQGLPSSFGDE